jgi:hypothetical protein
MCYSHIIIFIFFPSEKSEPPQMLLEKTQERAMNQLKTDGGAFFSSWVDVQTSRPVTAPGCQKTCAP